MTWRTFSFLLKGCLVVLLYAIPSSVAVPLLDATNEFVKSTESTFDHEISLTSSLTFHWNDVNGNTVEGRLIHKANSKADAPTWLGFGVYDTFANPVSSVTENTAFFDGSDAVIGVVANGGDVKKYNLQGKDVWYPDGAEPMTSQTLVFGTVKEHDSDDGSVTTVLSFEKLLDEAVVNEVRIRHSGENVFLWAVGDANGSVGAFKLDLDAVKTISEGGTPIGGGGDGPDNGAATSDANTSPVVLANCQSEIDGASMKIDLAPGVSFHYDVDTAASTMSGWLVYQGEGWVGHGFSSDGKMVGSTAVIGQPDNGSVQLFSLGDKTESAVIPASDQSPLVSSSITQEDGVTTLVFTVKLGADGLASATGLNSFLYAFGETNEFPRYHKQRESYRIDLSVCEAVRSTKSHIGAFAAHGIFATLAWAICSPFAMTVAWFRTLVPSSWIYIHVFSNVVSFLFTLVAVIIAVSTMALQSKSSHFYDPHHWVGLLLLLGITFQVMNGFLRPPVEKKDPYAASHYDMDNAWIKFPNTPRELWHFMHRMTGLALLSMGIYQIQSGLKLFALDFNVSSVVNWYWGYVGLFAICLLTLKFWIMYEEYKARRNMETMHVDHRSSGGSSSGGFSHTDSELVPVSFGDVS